MTKEERDLCRNLVMTPSGRRLSTTEFVERFPLAVDAGRVASHLLEDAYSHRDAEDLQCALIVGHTFGFGDEHVSVLCMLFDAEWHECHEDIISALGKLRSETAIPTLFKATQWVPGYLAYDDARALATKAIWAMGNIPSPAAESRLEELSHATDHILAQAAANQLARKRRNSGPYR